MKKKHEQLLLHPSTHQECYLWIQGYPGYGAPPEEYPSGADFLYKKLLGVGTSDTHNMHVNDE
jgi:hypothetical protein